jgi:hypothetical protein
MKDRTPSWERTGRVLLPALSLIAFIAAQVMGKYSKLSWALIILAVFFVVSGYRVEVKEAYDRWKARRDDRRTVEESFPVFREFVRRFGPFVDNRLNDTLHSIVRTELHLNLPNTQLIQFPQMDLWSSFWLYLSQRLDRQRPSMDEFRPALMEFHFLVATYCNYCVAPIFQYPPQNLHSQIAPATKGKLNLFQQRFVRFLGEYEEFATRLSKSRPVLEGLPYYCSAPPPIS